MIERDSVQGQKRAHRHARRAARRGLSVPRTFTTPGVDPAEEMAWELRTASIAGESGKVIFEQKEVEVPKTWSALATNVVASKYFRGPLGSPQRERSVRQLVGRVVQAIGAWGRKDGYFAAEEDAGAWLRGQLAGLFALPRLLRLRRHVQAARTVSDNELLQILTIPGQQAEGRGQQ